jgi:hypothetical protein
MQLCRLTDSHPQPGDPWCGFEMMKMRAAVPGRCRMRSPIGGSLTLSGARAAQSNSMLIADLILRSIRLENRWMLSSTTGMAVKIRARGIEKRITAVDNAMTAT